MSVLRLCVFITLIKQPIARFQWNLRRKTVFFRRISAMGKIAMFHITYFFYSWCSLGFGERHLFVSSPIQLFTSSSLWSWIHCELWKWKLTRCFVARRVDNFIVGLTDASPTFAPPTLWNYDLCGQYPGAVPSYATVSVQCPCSVTAHRYVVVQSPKRTRLNFCELEVFVRRKCQYIHYHQQAAETYWFMTSGSCQSAATSEIVKRCWSRVWHKMWNWRKRNF